LRAATPQSAQRDSGQTRAEDLARAWSAGRDAKALPAAFS